MTPKMMPGALLRVEQSYVSSTAFLVSTMETLLEKESQRVWRGLFLGSPWGLLDRSPFLSPQGPRVRVWECNIPG